MLELSCLIWNIYFWNPKSWIQHGRYLACLTLFGLIWRHNKRVIVTKVKKFQKLSTLCLIPPPPTPPFALWETTMDWNWGDKLRALAKIPKPPFVRSFQSISIARRKVYELSPLLALSTCFLFTFSRTETAILVRPTSEEFQSRLSKHRHKVKQCLFVVLFFKHWVKSAPQLYLTYCDRR